MIKIARHYYFLIAWLAVLGLSLATIAHGQTSTSTPPTATSTQPTITLFSAKDPNLTNHSINIAWRASALTDASLEMVCDPDSGSIRFNTDKNNYPSCEKGGVYAWSNQSSSSITMFPSGNTQPVSVDLTLSLTKNNQLTDSKKITVIFPATPSFIEVLFPNGGEVLNFPFSTSSYYSFDVGWGWNNLQIGDEIRVGLEKWETEKEVVAQIYAQTIQSTSGQFDMIATLPSSILIPSSHYRIAASVYRSGNPEPNGGAFLGDVSDASFTISNSPTISNISPNQGIANTNVTIYGTNLSGASSVEFYTSSSQFVGSIVPSLVSATSTRFTIPYSLAANISPGTYQVGVVTNACAGGCNSNRVGFTLVAPSITVLSPNGGEVWVIGSPRTILWSTQGISSSQLMSIGVRNTATNADYSILSGETINDGTESIVIPSSLPAGSYLLFIKTNLGSTTDTVVNDWSNAPFTLAPPSGSVAASPSSGTAPLSGVDVVVNAGGVAGDKYVYKFNCNNVDGSSYALTTPTVTQSIYTATNLCYYSNAGTYTILADVTRYRTATPVGEGAVTSVTNFAFTTTVTVGGIVPPPPPGGFWSRLSNAIIAVFVAQPSVDLKVKSPWDAPDENYTDGPIQIASGNSLRVSWQSSKVQDCRMNYFGLLPTNLGATAEGQAGEPVSHLGSTDGDSYSYQSPNEEGVMEFEFQCRKDTDGFEISDRVRVDLEALTAGTAGAITPPAPPVKGFLGRSVDRVRGIFGGVPTPSAPPAAPFQPEETVPPIAGVKEAPQTVPPIAGEKPTETSVPPVSGIRGLLNAILRVPETARTAVQKAIELVITRPQAPEPKTAEPVGVTPKPAEPVGVQQPTEQRGGEVQAPITGVKEPAASVPPVSGIAIPSLTNNVLDLGKAHSITWQYQRGGEVQAPVVYLYVVAEGLNSRTGQVVKLYSYLGSTRADAQSFAWSVPSDFVKPADPCCSFKYYIGFGRSSDSSNPDIQSTSNPITVSDPSPLITPKLVEPVAPPPTLIPPRIVEPVAPPPPPPPPSTILEPELKIAPPPPPPSTISEPTKVSPPPPPPPTVDIKANNSDGPVSISSGASATLSWTSTNASSCTTSGWSRGIATSGSQSTGALTSSQTYTISCTGLGGSASDSVGVNVTAKLKLFYNDEELKQIASVFSQLVEAVKKLGELIGGFTAGQ